jgi:hypothetical protein
MTTLDNKLDKENLFTNDLYRSEDVEEEISSWFYRPFTKSLQHNLILNKMTTAIDGENIKYEINNSFSYLVYSYLCFKTPHVKVKDEFKDKVRIALSHNFGINVVNKAVLKNDNDIINTLTQKTYDDYFQYLQNKGNNKKDNFNIGVGNIPKLEDWSENIEPHQINVYQPWYYGEDSYLAFPIYHKNTESKAAHIYTFEKDIKKLIKVQLLTGNDDNKIWKNVPNSDKNKYIELKYHSFTGENIPELWGKYSNITPDELNTYACKNKVIEETTGKIIEEIRERVFYYKDYIEFRSDNTSKLNRNITVNFKLDYPITSIFWKAINTTGEKYGNYSNYTTNSDNLYQGNDPIIKSSLTSGTTPIFKDMESHHFNIGESRNNFNNFPTETGYHGYSFSLDNSYTAGATSSVFINDGKLSCYLSNDPNKKEEENEEEEENEKEKSDSFSLNVILVYYRKMILTYDKEKAIINVI